MTLFQFITFFAEAVLNQEMGKVRDPRKVRTDQPTLRAGLQHLELPDLIHGVLVDEVELHLLPLGELWLHVEPDREGQGRDIQEGDVSPEEILMDGDFSSVIHKLDLDLRRGGVQDSGTVPERQ